MTNINWDLAPEGATEIVTDGDPKALRWAKKDSVWSCVNEGWKFRHTSWKTIATRPQPERKTVEDAVTEHKGEWPLCHGISLMGYSPKHDQFFTFSDGYHCCDGEYKVCTREEFEACVAAKGEPEWKELSVYGKPKSTGDKSEWTHKYRLGDSQYWLPCSIVTEVGTQGVVIKCDVFEGIQYCSYNGGQAIELKPIKPTISTTQAWKMVEGGESVKDIKSKYSVR